MRRRSFLGGLFALPALVVGYVRSRCAKADVKKGSIKDVKVKPSCKNTNCFVKWDHDNERMLISHDDIRTERVKNDKYKLTHDIVDKDQLLFITRGELGCIMESFTNITGGYAGYENDEGKAMVFYQRAMAQPPDYDIVVV